MGINGFPTNFPPQKALLFDRDAGLMTQDGRYLFLSLFQRTGNGAGFPSVAINLTAQGVGQSTGFLMGSDWNEFETVAAGSAAVIPIIETGGDIIVWNFGANTLNIFPSIALVPIQIDALGINQPYQLVTGKMQWLRQVSPTQIRSMKLG